MDKYEVVGLVGEGSFGRVFKATERGTNETVALKLIRKCGRTQKELISLRSECEIQRQLNHPNIIHMIDSFETEAEIIVVTEFCKKDLHEILGKEGYLKEDQIVGIVCDLVSALHYLHSHRVLHRDLKPQNVLLDDNGVAKLCDFGFARSMSRGTHVLTSIKGTPLYMAPELIEEHPYDHNADLWSLGCIVYEMLVGVPPFITNSILHLVRLIRYEPITWPDFLSNVCLIFLQGLLQKDPKQRLTWPYLHQHPFLQGKVFVDENICIPVPLTCELTSSQTLAKENQKQDIAMRAAAQNQRLLLCSLHTIEEQERKLALQRRRNGTSSSLQVNNLTHSNNGATGTPRGYSVGAISLATYGNGEIYPFSVGRANGITSVRQYGAGKVSNNDSKEVVDDLRFDKLSLEGPICRCTPFELTAVAAYKTNDLNRQNEERKENPQNVGVSSLAEIFPNEPTLTTTPLETEEWLVFLQQSMEEVLEGDMESIRDKSFISMVTAPLTNPAASSQVIEYIAILLSLPYVVDHVSSPELGQIQQVYLEGKVVASFMLSLKLLTSNIDYSASGDSFIDVSDLGADKLQAIESVSLVMSNLVYADTAFLSQFCDVVSMLHLELRLQALLTLRRRKIQMVTNFVAIFCQILKEMPENASLVEEVILTSQSPGEELHYMLTNENPILRSRSCMLLRLMGRFCCKSLRLFWNKELKNDIETLAFDSCQKVRSAADNAVEELKHLPFYTHSSWEKETAIIQVVLMVVSAMRPPPPKHVGTQSKSFQDNIVHAFSAWTPNSKKNIWELSGLYEGDIMLNHEEDDPRNALIDKDKLWSNGVVPYYISEDEFDKEEKEIIKGAVKEIEKETCVKFREYKEGDTDYVVVKSDAAGCWSFVGRKGGGQVLNLSEKCVRHGVAAHEFLHALGLHHQQSAPNRDEYVTVYWDNIESDHKHNFNKYNSSTVTDYGVGYDYNSIMHYSSHAFSKNEKETLTPKKEGVEIGQRKHLSDKDIEKLKRIYNCTKKSEAGGFGFYLFEDLLSL